MLILRTVARHHLPDLYKTNPMVLYLSPLFVPLRFISNRLSLRIFSFFCRFILPSLSLPLIFRQYRQMKGSTLHAIPKRN